MRRFIIVRPECQMKFTFAQIIGLRMLFQPGKLQLKITYLITQIYNDKIIGRLSSHFVQIESFVVEFYRTVQIGYIIVFMNHLKFHSTSPFAHSVFFIRDLYCGYSVINRFITLASSQ